LAASHDFIMVIGGRLLVALVSIATFRVATTYLNPAQYGELAILVAVQAFCGLFLVSPVSQHINRYTHQWWDDGTLLARFAFYGKYVFVVALIGVAAVYLFVTFSNVEDTLFAGFAMLVIVNAATWNATTVFMLNMLGFRASSVIWATVTVVVALMGSVAFMFWIPNATAWLFGQALGMAIGALGAGRVLRQSAYKPAHLPQVHSLISRAEVLSYCFPLAIATGLMWLQVSGYRFVVRAYWGVEALGYAAVGLLMAGQIWGLAETLVQQFLYPFFFRRISQANQSESQDALSDLLNFMGPLYLVLAGATFVGAPYILKLLAAPQYMGAEIFVRFGAAIECCRVLGNLLSQAAQVTKQTRSLALPYAAGATVAIGLMLISGNQGGSIVWVGVVLTLGALVCMLSLAMAMYQQVAYVLERRRWSVGILAMLLLTVPAWWLEQPEGWGETLGVILMIAIAVGVIMLGMIWNNAALQRLLAINLRNGT